MDSNNTPALSGGAKWFLGVSIVLFAGALGLFIWLVVAAAQAHMVRNILYGSAFLAITTGLLLYCLTLTKHPKGAVACLWSFIALGIATFIVGLCI